MTFFPEDGVGVAYEEWELDLLLQVVDEVDLRLSAAFRIAMDTGRRIDAILHIRTEDVEVETVWTDSVGEIELMRIRFRGENDKRRRTGWTYVTPATRQVVERLMQAEAVRASGWLFPNRQALTVKPLRREAKEIRPVNGEDFIDYLHKAELRTQEPVRRAANGGKFVEWKHGRGFHGIKRASVTIQGSEARNLEVAAKQSGTSVQMLQARYHQDHKEDRAEMVVSLAERRQKREARTKGKVSGK